MPSTSPSTFLETPIFPDDLAFWANGGPTYNTTVTSYGGGWESRFQNWQYGMGSWDLQNVMRAPNPAGTTIAQYNGYVLAVLRTLFRIMKGKLYSFRFRDWADYQDEGVGGFTANPGDLTGTQWQMVKNYALGALSDQRLIKKPRPGTIAIFKNGTQLTFGSGSGQVQLDTTTGIATFGTAITTETITWTGSFDVPVRFDVDALAATPDASGLWILQDLPIVEVRLQ